MKLFSVVLNGDNELKIINVRAESLEALTALPVLLVIEEGVLNYYSFNNLVSITDITE